MKDYIQQLIELFGHNNYSADTHKKVQQWLADEEHVDEKSEALRELWKQAGEQKVPDGMQQSIQRKITAGNKYLQHIDVEKATTERLFIK